MEDWKKAVLAGSAVVSVILLLKGKRTAGLVVGGVGLATLAAEYPDEFAKFRRRLPDYVERASTYMDVVGRVGERLADAAGGRHAGWVDALLSGD